MEWFKSFLSKLQSIIPSPKELDREELMFYADQSDIEQKAPPKAARVTLWVLAAVIVIVLVWACLAKVDKVVVGGGRLVTTGQTLKVQPLVPSIITRFDVEIGQTVKKGQPLVSLDPTFAQADKSRLEAREKSLAIHIKRLECELTDVEFLVSENSGTADAKVQMALYTGRQEEYASHTDAYNSNIAEIEAAIESLNQQFVEYSKQLKILREVESMYQQLYEKEVESKSGLLSAQYQTSNKQTEVVKIKNDIEEKRKNLDKAKSERDAFVSKWKNDISEELSSLRKEYDSVSEDLSKANKLHELSSLVSPANAVVLEFGAFSEGSVVREGEAIMTLVPLDVPIEAEVLIDPKDIGYVRTGDSCRIKLEAFPFQRHGTLSGIMRTVSDDVIQINENGYNIPKYKARIALDEVDLDNVPDDFRLLPGMSLSAEIKVGTRRVITFFIYPLIRAADESMREP